MPIDYKEYPANWKTEIRPSVLERAKNCCERCGIENHGFGLYAVSKLRWLMGGFAIADIARVIGCPSFGLLI